MWQKPIGSWDEQYHYALIEAAKEQQLEAAATTEQQHNRKMYGHVHVAKTGGSSLNSLFAYTFQRVCGNKGHSYDIMNEFGGGSKPVWQSMVETGFVNCDYISQEWASRLWYDTFVAGLGVKMELHVPCRDVIDHFMSQCNHYGIKFPCDPISDKSLYKTVNACIVRGRFDDFLLD